MRTYILDADNPAELRTMQREVGKLRGLWRIDIGRYRARRTDPQNRYYWPCIVAPFADYLRDQGEEATDEAAHEILKAKFNRGSVMNHETGESFEFVRSTADLDVDEFSAYVERCIVWLAEMGINVAMPTGGTDGHP